MLKKNFFEVREEKFKFYFKVYEKLESRILFFHMKRRINLAILIQKQGLWA